MNEHLFNLYYLPDVHVYLNVPMSVQSNTVVELFLFKTHIIFNIIPFEQLF